MHARSIFLIAFTLAPTLLGAPLPSENTALGQNLDIVRRAEELLSTALSKLSKRDAIVEPINVATIAHDKRAVTKRPGSNGKRDLEERAVTRRPGSNGKRDIEERAVTRRPGSNGKRELEDRAVTRRPGSNGKREIEDRAVTKGPGGNGKREIEDRAVTKGPGGNGK